jgi:hypothetical protein
MLSDSHVAARAQCAGFARQNNIEQTFSTPQLQQPPPTSDPIATSTESNKAQAAMELAQDKAVVEAELKRYFDEGLLEDDDELEDFDLAFYWQVSNSSFILWIALLSFKH